MLKKENLSSLTLQKLATSVGRLNWDDVLPITEERLGSLDIPIYVYTQDT